MQALSHMRSSGSRVNPNTSTLSLRQEPVVAGACNIHLALGMKRGVGTWLVIPR